MRSSIDVGRWDFLAGGARAAVGLLAGHARPGAIPVLMAVAAGAMGFVSIHELVPMARRYRRLPLFAAGALVSAVVYAVLSAGLSE